jgi:hypothetical protein
MYLMDLSAWAATAAERLDESAIVLSEVMEAPDQDIPQDLLENAQRVMTVPSAKKGRSSPAHNTEEVLQFAGMSAIRAGALPRPCA